MNYDIKDNVKDVRIMRGSYRVLGAGKPKELGPLVVPLLVSGVTSKGISVRFKLHKGGVGIMATYTAKARDVKRTCHAVRYSSTSIVITNKARTTVAPANFNNFTTLATLASSASPREYSVPFSGREDNFMVNRNTNIMILRRLRRTGTHKTGVLNRIIKCNTAKSTCRVASPTRSNSNTTGTVR